MARLLDTPSNMKRIVFIPVIHNLADLGSLAVSVRDHYLQRLGPAAWSQRERAIEQLWADIRQGIEALRLDYGSVRIYQDGLPVCGKEEQIVQELALAGSLNHQVIVELMGEGACLVGTEDPQLLIREYQLHQQQVWAGGGTSPASPGEAAELLAARDRFIAERIANTLQKGETGLLFLGAAHRLDALHATGIEIRTLNQAVHRSQ
jgi:hypothetical protein